MRKLILLFCSTFVLTRCTELIEQNLDGFGVVLLTPQDNYSTSVNQVGFRWESVPHATGYHLQVATPDFAAPNAYVLDSVVSSDAFTVSLTPASYQWRVRAENSSSHTEWYTRSLTITSSGSLTGQVPVLVAPADNAITDSNSVIFTWDTLPHATDYRFELRQDNSNGTVLQALIVSENHLTLSSLADGKYAWGVQAQNNVPSSSDFAYRTLTVDVTPPGAPIQLAPAPAAIIPQAPFSYLWQSGHDALTSTSDSLVVQNSLLQVIHAIGNASGTFADSLGSGTYTWRVKTMDAAGNSSSAGPITFTVQ